MTRPEAKGSQKVRIAVIGSGLAGLSAAYLLTRGKERGDEDDDVFDVTLYEREGKVGMDAASVSVECPCLSCSSDATSTHEHIFGRVDVPMRALTVGYYPGVLRLYKQAGVPLQSSHWLYSFGTFPASASTSEGDVPSGFQPYYILSRWTLFSKMLVLPSLLPRLPSFSFLDLLFPFFYLAVFRYLLKVVSLTSEWLRLNGVLRELALKDEIKSVSGTFGDYLAREGYSKDFAYGVLLPHLSIVCTCSFQDAANYPARFILDFLARSMFDMKRLESTNLLMDTNDERSKVFVVSCGVQRVCSTLTKGLSDIRLNTGVEAVYRDAQTGRLLVLDGRGRTTEFDHVIFATQANQVVRILNNGSKNNADFDQRKVTSLLETVKYVRTSVVVHSDERVMPKRRADWREVNFVSFSDWSRLPKTLTIAGRDQSVKREIPVTQSSMCSHFLNPEITSLGTTTSFFATYNPIISIDQDKVISCSVFDRAVVTLESAEALSRMKKVQGTDNIWVIGSYVFPGVPLLEGCVQSALRCVKAIGYREGHKLSFPWLESENCSSPSW